jgi:hypothetical protein
LEVFLVATLPQTHLERKRMPSVMLLTGPLKKLGFDQ